MRHRPGRTGPRAGRSRPRTGAPIGAPSLATGCHIQMRFCGRLCFTCHSGGCALEGGAREMKGAFPLRNLVRNWPFRSSNQLSGGVSLFGTSVQAQCTNGTANPACPARAPRDRGFDVRRGNRSTRLTAMGCILRLRFSRRRQRQKSVSPRSTNGLFPSGCPPYGGRLCRSQSVARSQWVSCSDRLTSHNSGCRSSQSENSRWN
jgi:hypothetical protein